MTLLKLDCLPWNQATYRTRSVRWKTRWYRL